VDLGGTSLIAGIDFSDGAMCAVREGRWLASRTGLTLHVLHVTGEGANWQPTRPMWNWLREAAIHPSSLLVRRGLAWVELVRHAKEVSAAMIVIGSHGATGYQSVQLGSTANRVALRAPCPVLCVNGWREALTASETSPTTSFLSEEPS
jgi:nucleotide-binding universal stress UspA family protein